jgi:hypothetical protein
MNSKKPFATSPTVAHVAASRSIVHQMSINTHYTSAIRTTNTPNTKRVKHLNGGRLRKVLNEVQE